MSRLLIAAIAAVLIVATGGIHPPIAQAQEKKPNVIVILSDDVGYGEYGFQGNKDIPTPNIDSIAKNGVRFTQGYNAATYCSPSRAGLLTGRYPTRYGHEFNGGGAAGGKDFGLPVTEKTIADRLKSLGYSTACVGKWHLGHGPQFIATARGFDEFYGTVANTPFFNPPNFIDTRKSPDITPVKDDNFYTTDAYGERAADWIGKQKDKPFFLYLPFNAQHAPLQATKKYLDRVKDIPEGNRKTFAAMMIAMDDAVGKVLAKVKEMGQEENTIIVFLSDNGGPTMQTTSKNDPLRGRKATTLEGGIRVPFCMQWKGKIKAGTTYEHPIMNLDILPTAIVAAGGKIDPAWKLDGVDLMPYITGKVKESPHPVMYWRFGNQWAIRKGDLKLVASAVDGVDKVLLYNLKDDIGESKDLAAAMPDKVKELKADWDKWSAQQEKPRWVPAKKKGKKDKDE
ncbi:MAG: sulfatase-like hydrolase/transferase [Planctomycetia bacterium]|nr:sulfatase-like hydrolase/transferase [Planctomycetia bacterium]